ncbi:MAG: mechanosensitive ion channel family protein [Rivularia sp. (in: cyanobacteria)]
MALIRRVPPQFWIDLGIDILQSFAIVISGVLLTRLADNLITKASIWGKNREQTSADDQNIDIFFTFLSKTITIGIWLLALISCSKIFQVPETALEYLFIILRIYLILAIGLLILKAMPVVTDRLDILSLRYTSADNLLRLYDRLRKIVPFLKRSLAATIYVLMITLVIEQIESIANLASWGTRIIKLIAIFSISYVLVELAYLGIEELLLNNQKISEADMQRRLTIIPLVQSSSRYTIYFGAGIFILEAFDINPAPILAAAGIFGLALSLGAQKLVNDIVSGFFILFENYYLVGDYIAAGNVEEREIEGFVEAIELRTTRLRHPNGQLQIVRNGDVGSIVNYSKNYIYAMVELRLNYDVELERVYSIVESIGQQLKANYSEVLEPTQVDGIEEFGESYMLLGMRTKVKPGKKLTIERILRKMLKDAFKQEEIQIYSRPVE